MSCKSLIPLSFICILCVNLLACDNRGELPITKFVLEKDVADSYITFINPQQKFSAAIYNLIVLPEIAITSESENPSYTLTITDISDGIGDDAIESNTATEVVRYQGNWSERSDLNWQNYLLNNHQLDLTSHQNFLLDVQCSQACQLYIVKSNYLHVKIRSNQQQQIQYAIHDSPINSVAYAEQYYTAVDPANERMTLESWKNKNGFDQGDDVHVIFRDSKDLGYGRDMYARRNEDGSLAFYVNNFVVSIGESNPEDYGPLNLLAATDQNFDYHLGTNAIEFSAIDPDNPSSEKILKFFTFSAANEQGIQPRITSADLDGRGIKHMPSICLACHGGTLLPLNPDGSFSDITLKSAKLNQFELDTFEFLETGGFSESEQQAGIKTINQWVRDSYVEMGQRDQTERGFWDSDFSEHISNLRYGDENFGLANYQADTVPIGWQQTSFRPEGVENLYLQVVEPHCISCHSLRGYQAGDDTLVDTLIINDQEVKLGNAINFSSYEKFISYSEVIIDYVYRRGIMPLSLRNAERFWQKPYSAPALLASFLANFDVLNTQGEIEPPGLPIARLEAERISSLPMTLHGGSSYFATNYQWSIISGPSEHDAQLEQPNEKVTRLVGTIEGQYVVSLRVSNSRGEHSTEMLVEVDSSKKTESEINFVDDIKPLLQSQLFNLRTCQSCHNPITGIEGIPIFYDDSNTRLYADIKARANLSTPIDSLLLLKPTRYQHGGGIRFDLETVLGLESYNTILQWIIAGAPCGNDDTICP